MLQDELVSVEQVPDAQSTGLDGFFSFLDQLF